MSEHVFVKLQRDPDGYPPYEAEEIDAVPEGKDRYRIAGTPVFVYGLAREDVVTAVRTPDDGRLWVTGVVAPGGHWTARVLPWNAELLESTADAFTKLGCRAAATPFGMVAVDVPPSLPARIVMDELTRGRDVGEWDFDLGVSPAGP